MSGWKSTVLFVAAMLVAASVRSDESPPSLSLGITEADLRFNLQSVDEAHLVLLEPSHIANDPGWRAHFSGQVFGYGVRTEPQVVSKADVERIKALLLDSSSWIEGEKSCETAGDAALFMRSPFGEVTIMLELWCARAHVVSETMECLRAYGQIDPIAKELRNLTRRYFPNDTYLQSLD
jgi:hypothetical protein